MHRTTVMLPDDLKSRAKTQAGKMGVSLGQAIRNSLTEWLRKVEEPDQEDLLLADDAVFEGSSPSDLAINHDSYLYGEGRDLP